MKSLKVKDYMARRLITFRRDTNVVEAMEVFLNNKISGAPVTRRMRRTPRNPPFWRP